MKPTVISTANANSSANSGNTDPTAHINIPLNRGPATANAGSYGSPRQQPHQIPAHFQQDFGFEPDMDIDMDMFPRGRLGRMHHDPFAGFGGSHFGFPQFGSMSRRRAPAASTTEPMMGEDNDFFTRLPSEFRQYIPEGFGHRRGGSGTVPHHPQQQQQMPPQYHQYQTGSTPPNSYAQMPPQSPSKKLCDAAIQTEDTIGAPAQDQVDYATKQGDNLNQHGLRNTVDMGVKAPPEGEQPGPRAHSAPPPEQMQQDNVGQTQFGGPQTNSQTQTSNAYQKSYYPPHQQSHPMQKQRTPPPSTGAQPQTPGGTFIRTIPIFVEGRSEPIINAHKEIPNQNAPPQQSQQHAKPHPQQQYAPGSQHHPPPHPQQRPTPLNTQQQPTNQQQTAGGPPPQTPHTLDSINKIQDIQRDVLELMGKVEKFPGTREDKDYAYLDEMLTRNLLKLDTIDTQGKDSIRLARKEAIKCIQASINVLEAKAEENGKTAKADKGGVEESPAAQPANTEVANVETSNEQNEAAGEANPQEPIPLPPPAEVKSANSESKENPDKSKEASPKAAEVVVVENSATNESK